MTVSSLRLLLVACCCCWWIPTASRAERKLPRHIYLRDPQPFSVHIPVSVQKKSTGVANATSKVDLIAFSVLPDTQIGKAYVLFSYLYREWKPFTAAFPLNAPSCHAGQCANLLEHFTNPWFGNIRCQFERPDGTVLESAPTRVRAHSATVSTSAVFVGTCDLPAEFRALVSKDSFDNPPKIRLLREHDVAGVPTGANNDDPAAVFEPLVGLRCHGLRKQDATSKDACEQNCLRSVNFHRGKICTAWHWTDERGCYQSSELRMMSCKPNGDASLGGRRRFDAWDAIETARSEKKLLTFGCSMPVFGDGSYMNRIPQWLEFQLLNFPDTHFFLYLRGGDGFGGYTNRTNAIPGAVGGVAVLYPYIEAGVVTVVWLPPDRAQLLLQSKNPFQKRDENDFLYRAKHLSEWISVSIDYDEYFAPTRTVDAKGMAKQAGSVVHIDQAIDVDWTGNDGEVFYPIGAMLTQVSADVQQLTFHKWPAEIPDQASKVYLETNTIAADSTRGRLGKYILRPADARLVFTHFPIVAEEVGELDRQHSGHLIVGNTEYNLLHFRDRDWAEVANSTEDVKPYTLTHDIAVAVKERLWFRYNGRLDNRRGATSTR